MSRRKKHISLLEKIAKIIGSFLVTIDRKYSKPVSTILFMVPIVISIGVIYLLVYYTPMLTLALFGIAVMGIAVLIIQNHHMATQFELEINNKELDLEREKFEANPVDYKSVQDIIYDKLNNNVIEEIVESMVDDITNDLFGKESELHKNIQKELSESIDNHINRYDFNTEIKERLITKQEKEPLSDIVNLNNMYKEFKQSFNHVPNDVSKPHIDIKFINDDHLNVSLTADIMSTKIDILLNKHNENDEFWYIEFIDIKDKKIFEDSEPKTQFEVYLLDIFNNNRKIIVSDEFQVKL